MNSLKILSISLALFALNSFGQLSPASTKTLPSPQTKNKLLPMLDIYGAIPRCTNGGGLGLGVFSKPFPMEELGPKQKLELRLGGDFYFVQDFQRYLGTVPLAAPQTGDAKVRMSQSNFGLNAVARFLVTSTPDKITPYLDVFAGLRGFSTDLNITPLHYQSGYEQNTSTNLSTTTHWNYGATIGFMYALGKKVKINTGLMYTTSNQYGQIEDVKGATVEGGTIIADKMNTPKNAFVFKVGLTFLIEKSNYRGNSYNCNCNNNRGIGMGAYVPFSGGGAFRSANHVNINIRPSK